MISRLRDILRIRTRIRMFIVKLLHICGELTGIPHLRFYCPVCDRKVRGWFPSGECLRLDATGEFCPHCFSMERTRHFALYLKQNDILNSKIRMLHFAPEKSLETKIRSSILGEQYLTTDLFMKKVDRKEDIIKMTFADNSFDFIYCSHVLEHIEDDASAMAELFRILSPGGTIVIQVPIQGFKTYEDPSIVTPRERIKHFGQNDHVRFYGEDIRDRLSTVGFEVSAFYMLDVLSVNEEEIETMNISARELTHKCTKPH
ncbi:MAG: methyltransferase domain-containing protein [Candidatus Peribacteraceae bacterium]|nr:methyltransferase domain-containing protein [Candidatus Peribacteraceae bacterium]